MYFLNLQFCLNYGSRKDDNQDSSFGSHKKYITRQQVPRSSDEDGEKSSALKSFSVFARLLEEKRYLVRFLDHQYIWF